MQITNLLADTTTATTSSVFTVDGSQIVVVRASGSSGLGHAGAETSQLQYQDNSGDWLTFASLRGGTVCNGTFSSTVSVIPLFERGVYRVNKGATAAAVGFELVTA